jgi:hypothetical protein
MLNFIIAQMQPDYASYLILNNNNSRPQTAGDCHK